MTFAREKQELEQQITEGLADLEHRKQRLGYLMEKIGDLGMLAARIQEGRVELRQILDNFQTIFVKQGIISKLSELKKREKDNLYEQDRVLETRIAQFESEVESLQVLTEIPAPEERVRRDKDLLQPEEYADYLLQEFGAKQ